MESEIQGRDPFNQNSDRSDREKWSTSKGGRFFETFPVGPAEPVHRVLDQSFRKIWSNGSRPWALKSGIQLKESGIAPIIAIRNPEVPLTKNPESGSGNPDYPTGHGQSTVKTTSFILIQAFRKKKTEDTKTFINVNMRVGFFFSLQTCFMLNLVNLTILYGKWPILNKLVTAIKANFR